MNQQNQQHEKYRGDEGGSQEAGSLLLIGALARCIHPYPIRQFQPTVQQRVEPLSHLGAVGQIGFDSHCAIAINTIEHAGFRRRFDRDEITDGHLPSGRLHSEPGQLLDGAPAFREAHTDIHFIAGVFRAVFRQQQTVGNHLHRVADSEHIGAKPSGSRAVHVHQPLNTREAAVIFDIDKIAQAIHLLDYQFDRRVDGFLLQPRHM